MKIFSLEEADELLPAVKESMERVFELNEMLKATANDTDDLLEIWGAEVYQKNHVDNEYYTKLLKRHDELMKQLRSEIRSVHKLGCLVKDIERGLVDFYFDMDGELVFLCWRYGEEKIRYWHSLNSGFSGRRPITDLFAMHRR